MSGCTHYPLYHHHHSSLDALHKMSQLLNNSDENLVWETMASSVDQSGGGFDLTGINWTSLNFDGFVSDLPAHANIPPFSTQRYHRNEANSCPDTVTPAANQTSKHATENARNIRHNSDQTQSDISAVEVRTVYSV